MFRSFARVTVSGAAALGVAIGTGVVAGAEPAPQPTLCNFTLSDPQVVEVSGTQMVTATLTPAGCTGEAKPNGVQVCVSSTTSVGRCSDQPGYQTARVYVSPYIPGQSYTADGRGCATVLQPPSVVCSSVGPRTVTL